jgi:hypothetical protein
MINNILLLAYENLFLLLITGIIIVYLLGFPVHN